MRITMNQPNKEIAVIRNQISKYDTILKYADLSPEYRKHLEIKKEKLQIGLKFRLNEQ